MVDQDQVLQGISLTFSILYNQLLFLFHILRAVFRVIVPPTPKDVSGEVVLITGAGHGMGREMALRFSKLGAVIVCVDINAQGNEETVSMIKQSNGKAFSYECDVTNRSSVIVLEERVSREVGDVTILVNNAGVMPCKPFLKHTEQEIRKTTDVNIHGYMWMIQAFLPSMIQNNRGQLVTMSSLCGMMGSENLVPYCASKHALIGMMDALNTELNENKSNKIKLTTICPYMVNTGLFKKARIRFPSLLKVVEPGDAAELAVDAIRREHSLVTIPGELFYSHTFFFQLLPNAARKVIRDFLATGVYEQD